MRFWMILLLVGLFGRESLAHAQPPVVERSLYSASANAGVNTLSDAIQDYRHGQYAPVLATLTHWLETSGQVSSVTDQAKAHYYCGLAAIQLGQSAQAVAHYQEALSRVAPSHPLHPLATQGLQLALQSQEGLDVPPPVPSMAANPVISSANNPAAIDPSLMALMASMGGNSGSKDSNNNMSWMMPFMMSGQNSGGQNPISPELFSTMMTQSMMGNLDWASASKKDDE